jgi:hypothetical protein
VEWRDLATNIGHASRSIAFIVGDWLVHGQSSFGPDAVPERRVPLDAYRQAIAATGMDLSTVQNYAYVSRNVPAASSATPSSATWSRSCGSTTSSEPCRPPESPPPRHQPQWRFRPGSVAFSPAMPRPWRLP